MARPLRIEYPGAFYHVTARGIEQRTILETDADRKRFLSYLESAHERYGAIIHVYCLMANHYHLLIETPRANLSRVLHHINGAYTMYFNIRRRRTGHLFEGRYRALLVEKDAYGQALSRYIHLNPVRAGLVRQPSEYPWSSYRCYVGLQQVHAWMTTRFILGYFGNDGPSARRRYREFVEDSSDGVPDNPMHAVVASTFLGDEEFIESVKTRWLDVKNTDTRNVPAVRHMIERPSLSRIQEVVGEVCEEQGRVYRQLCLYVSQQYGGFSLREIGNYHGMKEAAVSQANRRFKQRISEDDCLRTTLEDIIGRVRLLNVET